MLRRSVQPMLRPCSAPVAQTRGLASVRPGRCGTIADLLSTLTFSWRSGIVVLWYREISDMSSFAVTPQFVVAAVLVVEGVALSLVSVISARRRRRPAAGRPRTQRGERAHLVSSVSLALEVVCLGLVLFVMLGVIKGTASTIVLALGILSMFI